ncbi:MAG TPA: hypothetical protein VM074_11280 [Solimonas sp.]|nr:hypothetical protein [Solimonas sp.]
MSGPEREKPDDSVLEEFLAGRSEVSQAYRAVAKEAPPAELDNIVLDRMQREAERVPAPARMPRARLWERARWPVAAAALFMLSFNVFFLIREDREARQATMLEPEVPLPASVPMESPAASDMAATQAEPPALEESGTALAKREDAFVPSPPPAAAKERARSTPLRDQGYAAKPMAPAVGGAQREEAPSPAAAPEAASGALGRSAASNAAPVAASPPAFAAQAEERKAIEMREQESRRKRSSMESDQARAEKSVSAQAVQRQAGGEVQAFLDRPGVRRLPGPAVTLDQPQQVLRQGARQADGSCEFPAPPADAATPAGSSLVELQLAIDPATCEALVERGYLGRAR